MTHFILLSSLPYSYQNYKTGRVTLGHREQQQFSARGLGPAGQFMLTHSSAHILGVDWNMKFEFF